MVDLEEKWVHLFEKLVDIMNNIDPKIKYEFESSANTHNNSLPYLDVRVIITEGIIITDVYSKPTDTYNYLPFNRAHPRHVVRNIPYSLARRIKGIVSNENLLEVRMRNMILRLKTKKYPTKLFKMQSIRQCQFLAMI